MHILNKSGSGSRASTKGQWEPSSQETSSSLLMEYLSFDIPKHGDQEETPEDESSAARTDNFASTISRSAFLIITLNRKP